MDHVRARSLFSKRVVTRDGLDLGEVLDLELEVASWQVRWIFIGLTRDLVHRFHADAPFVMGTKAIALLPRHAQSVSGDTVRLSLTLSETVQEAVVSFDTDGLRHIGQPG